MMDIIVQTLQILTHFVTIEHGPILKEKPTATIGETRLWEHIDLRGVGEWHALSGCGEGALT